MEGRRSELAISMQVPAAASRIRQELSGDMLKRLVDKSYEKRWFAAVELQHLIQGLAESEKLALLSDCIDFFTSEFLASSNQLHKLGGLLAYSAIALGMAKNPDCAGLYKSLMMPVIACFSDADVLISFYAAETMYNIAKVEMSKEHVLVALTQMLIPLVALFASVEQQVRQAVQQLDCVLKSIVVETDADHIYLDHSVLMDFIGEKLRSVKNPNAQQMIVTWLTVLQSIPSFQLLKYLSVFLEGLFQLLAVKSMEVQQTALNALKEILSEIKGRLDEPNVDLEFITKTMSKLCSEGESMVRLRALLWLDGLLEVSGSRMIPDYSDLFDSVTRCLLDSDPDVISTSSSVHRRMLQYIQTLDLPLHSSRHLQNIIEVLILHIEGPVSRTWETLMDWLTTLYKRNAEILGPMIDRITSVLIERLAEPLEHALETTLNALCLISNYEGICRQVIVQILDLFKEKRQFMEQSGDIVVIVLCSNLGSEKVYRAFAEILYGEKDEMFGRKVVELLDFLLLTESQLADFREKIRICFDSRTKEQIDLFHQLFITWCINPVSGLNLCFLAQAYELAYEILLILSRTRITVDILMQLARLVQMLETPIFTQLRVQMLEPARYPYLLKALYGLLMILPQSKAYATLECRLSTAVILRQEIVVQTGDPDCFKPPIPD